MHQAFDRVDGRPEHAPQTVSPIADAGAERREGRRERTYKAARIGFGGGRAVTGCVVRNLSTTGACLSVEKSAQIPDRFNLVFDSGEPSRTAHVIWRSATRLGVRFE
jgi:hypothetical protein